MKLFRELVVCLIAFAVLVAIYSHFQVKVAAGHGRGWDGYFYYSVAEQFTKGQVPTERAPFIYRVGTPFLASVADPQNLLHGFWMANIAASAVSVFLLIVWLGFFISSSALRVLLTILFMLPWHGPVRFIQFNSADTHPWMFVFLIGGLILGELYRNGRISLPAASITLSIWVSAGVLFREVSLVIAIYFVALAYFRRELRNPLIYLPLISGALSYWILKHWVHATDQYGFFKALTYWLWTKPVLSYVYGWFNTFGPLLVFLYLGRAEVRNFFKERKALLLLVIVLAGLAYVGGCDTEHFLYWLAPIFLVVLGWVWEHAKTWPQDKRRAVAFGVLLWGGWALSQRVFLSIPSDQVENPRHVMPFLTPVCSGSAFLDIYSCHGNHNVGLAALSQHILLFGALIWISRRESA